jgi:hypothetical protein
MFEIKFQCVLLLVEAVVYLALAGWSLTRTREGSWAIAVAAGATLVGVVFGISAAASAEQIFFDTTHIYEKLFFHEHFFTVLTVARLAGALLLAAGFVQSRRTPAASSGGSIYGR